MQLDNAQASGEQASMLLHGEGEVEDGGLYEIFDLAVPLVRRRRTIFYFALAGLLGGLLWTLIKGSYFSTVSVLPPQASVGNNLLSQLGGLAGLSGNGGGFGLGHTNQDLYVSLLQSVSVEDAVVKRFKLDAAYEQGSPGGARAELQKRLTVDGSGRDGIIHLTIRDETNPKRAAEIANGYIEEFKSFMTHLAIGQAAQRRAFFEQQMQLEKASLTEAEENVQKTEQKSGAVQLDAQTRTLIDAAANLRAQVAAKQVEIRSIQSYAGPENINLQRAERELSQLRAQLATVSGPGGDTGDSMMMSRNSIPQTAIANIRAQRDLKYHEAIFGILSNEYASARLDEAQEGSPLQVVDAAMVPEGRSGRSAAAKVVIGLLLGLFVGAGYVLIGYGWSRLRSEKAFVQVMQKIQSSYSKAA